MPKGGPIYNPDVQSDIDMKNTYKLVNYPASTSILSMANTIYVDGVNGSSGGQRGTSSAFQTIAQAIAVLQNGDSIVLRPGIYTSGGTINKTGVTLYGNGAVISVTEGTVGVLSITSNNVTIRDLEINGNRISSGATPDNGVIEITSSNCKLFNVYVHDAVGYGIRFISGYSGAKVIQCRCERVQIGIVGAPNISAGVSDLILDGNTITDTRDRGIQINGNVGSSFFVSKLKVINNNVSCSSPNSTLGIELFGGISDYVVLGNSVYGYAFGISNDHCLKGVCNANQVRAATTVALELAGCKQVNFVGNNIDGTNLSGTKVGGTAIGISNSYSVPNDTGPFLVSGNQVSGLATGYCIDVQASNDVLIVGNESLGNDTDAGELRVLSTFRSRVISNSLKTVKTTGGAVTVDGAGRGCTDIFINGNTIDTSGGGQVISLVSVSGNNLDNVIISDNVVPSGGFFGAGYVYTNLAGGAQLTGYVSQNNRPASSAINNIQNGFINEDYASIIDFTNTDSTNTGGANNHLLLNNSSSTGQTVTSRLINSTLRFKHRTDYVGGNYFTGGAAYSFDAPVTSTNSFYQGTGSPEGVVTANVGSVYERTDGSLGSTFYQKYTGSGNTGWVATPTLDGSGKVPASQLPTLSAGTIASTTEVLKGDGSGNAIASTPTGTGDNVLATSPTLITPTIGAATATSLNKWAFTAPSTAATLVPGADNKSWTLPELGGNVGFREIPTGSHSADYTTVLTDNGRCVYHPASDANARIFTIDSHANVTWPDGAAIMFENFSANSLSIAITTDTMYLAGSGTTGTRTLAQWGRALARYTLATNSWMISGINIS